MGRIRFLDHGRNHVAGATLGSSSQALAVIGAAVKEGTGGASLSPGGTFTGAEELEYTVAIDDISAGVSIGEATFRWKTNESDGWEATGVATSTSPVALNNGIAVSWSSGTGDDFALGDKWTFKVIRFWSHTRVRDLDPDTAWRSKDTPDATEWLKFDFGSAKTVRAVVLHNHNLRASAVITLKGNTVDSWAAPAFSQTLTYRDGSMLEYLSSAQTLQWWRLEISDALNPDNHLQVGEVFLGDYLEPAKTFFQGFEEGYEPVEENELTKAGISRPSFANRRWGARLVFHLPIAEVNNLKAIYEKVRETETLRKRPLFINLDSADAARTHLFFWEGEFRYRNEAFDRYELEMELLEAAKSPV